MLAKPTPTLEGGYAAMHAAVRDSGSARSGDHLLASPRNVIIKAMAAAWPA